MIHSITYTTNLTLDGIVRQVSLSSFAFLFSEIVQYSQTRVSSIADLEKKYIPPTFFSSYNARVHDTNCRMDVVQIGDIGLQHRPETH